MFDLNGKVALVAGGAGYLATPICEALAGQGAAVMVADLAHERAQALAGVMTSAGHKAGAIRLDVGIEQSVREAVAATCEKLGGLDILVNATYHSIGKTVDELGADEFDIANRVNLTGAFLLAREAAGAMQPGGSVIMFASMYGQVSPDPRVYEPPLKPNPIEYGVAKAGIIQMVRYLAVAWASRGIRVNAISPGPFPSPAVQKAAPDFIRRLVQKVPLGRIGAAGEIAAPVVLLASDEGSYITGETLNVNGGWTAW